MFSIRQQGSDCGDLAVEFFMTGRFFCAAINIDEGYAIPYGASSNQERQELAIVFIVPRFVAFDDSIAQSHG